MAGYAGDYNVVQNCGFSGGVTSVFTSTITTDSVNPTRVRVGDFRNSSVTVFAEGSCSNGFIIPLQAPPSVNFTVEGGGSLNGSTLALNYTTTRLGSNSSMYCNATHTR